MKSNLRKYLQVFLLILMLVFTGGVTARSSAQNDPGFDQSLQAVGQWVQVASLATPRRNHTATLLLNGSVLVVGGATTGNLVTASVECYDPVSGVWEIAATLPEPRMGHSATLLTDGRLLIAGGVENEQTVLQSALIFDPISASWKNIPNMINARNAHTATLLADGRVMVIGGSNLSGPLASVEIYNPTANTWTEVAPLPHALESHTATLLKDGRVLVAGGAASSIAVVYNLADNSWTIMTGLLPRQLHTANALQDGRVFIAGGRNSGVEEETQYFDPTTDIFSAGPIIDGRSGHTATLLPSGNTLLVGGLSSAVLENSKSTYPLASVNGEVNTLFSDTILYHATALLPTGEVLVVGGYDVENSTPKAEVFRYSYATPSWTSLSLGEFMRYRHRAVQLLDGHVLITGGIYSGNTTNTAILYNPTDDSRVYAASMAVSRIDHAVALLPDGKVLVAGGQNFDGSTWHWLKGAELYNPQTNTWQTLPDMANAKFYPTATLLPDGRVLVVGGQVANGSAEIWNPQTGSWTVAANPSQAHQRHTSTLLKDGRVLVAGGNNNSAEVYDPLSNSWTNTANTLSIPRSWHTATLLPDGSVLVVGGASNNTANPADIYNPTTNSFTQTSQPVANRTQHAAVLLNNGKVLIAGGNEDDGSYLPIKTVLLFDWRTSEFQAVSDMFGPRRQLSLTTLVDGRAMAYGGDGDISSRVEFFDPGFGYETTWKPSFDPAGISFPQGAVTFNGSQLRGVGYAEGSGGTAFSSASNYPLVSLRRLGNDELVWLSTRQFSTDSFTVSTSWPIQPGPAVMTVFVNGIPSLSQTVTIREPERIFLPLCTR
jgi:N-acetylneuraminic acid mutarotase